MEKEDLIVYMIVQEDVIQFKDIFFIQFIQNKNLF